MSRRTETVERAGGEGEVSIRECTTIEEFDTCVRLQREVFHMPDLELSPRRHLIVSRLAGGWILGAYRADGELVGFVHHLVAVRGAEIAGYSHMMAVSAAYQNRGLGARLKWAQRERALAEGRNLIRWTFEPMQARNAHFNINRLGVVIRSYRVNFYGWDAGTEAVADDGRPFNLDSDRLLVEWELRTPRVEACARRESSSHRFAPAAAVEIPPDWNMLRREDGRAAEGELLRVRAEFQKHFATGLVCAGFERDAARPCYLFYEGE